MDLRNAIFMLLFVGKYHQSGAKLEVGGLEENVTIVTASTTAIVPPVELTHLFLNKDGTLDSSRLFSATHRHFGAAEMSQTSSKGDLDDLEKNPTIAHRGRGGQTMSMKTVFLTKNETRYSAHSGSTVILACTVDDESKFEMIMWARQLKGANASYQILTIGDSTHINDNRFLITKSTINNDWSLRIQRLNESDSGTYKCQANSHPPQFIATYLSIHEAFAEIDGPSEKFIKAGSALVLNCTFKRLTEKPAFVFWYHNSRMISHDRQRGQNVSIHANFSTLQIPHVSGPLDSGNYTCEPENLRPSMVTVHILGGDGSGGKDGGEETESAAAVHDDDQESAGGVDLVSMAASLGHKIQILWYLYIIMLWTLIN